MHHMSTYKRRIVYLSDDEWEGLKGIAQMRMSTISATIRDMMEEAIRDEVKMMQALAEAAPKPIRPIKGATQKERDDFLRAINRG